MEHINTKVKISQDKPQGFTMGIEKTPGPRLCPRCQTADLHRSQMRGLIERGILRAIGFRAYRCDSCDHRFYSLGRARESEKSVEKGPSVR